MGRHWGKEALTQGAQNPEVPGYRGLGSSEPRPGEGPLDPLCLGLTAMPSFPSSFPDKWNKTEESEHSNCREGSRQRLRAPHLGCGLPQPHPRWGSHFLHGISDPSQPTLQAGASQAGHETSPRVQLPPPLARLAPSS